MHDGGAKCAASLSRGLGWGKKRLAMTDEASIVANLRRLHAVGSHVYFEDPDFVASDKSLFTVCA